MCKECSRDLWTSTRQMVSKPTQDEDRESKERGHPILDKKVFEEVFHHPAEFRRCPPPAPTRD